jgi:hypothetical protein
MRKVLTILVGVFWAAAVTGCGGGTADNQNLSQQAGAKLEAMRQLADAVGRNAPAGELAPLVEVFISNSIDVKTNADEAKQIVEFYNAKVKGKLRGESAAQVKSVVDGIVSDLKR